MAQSFDLFFNFDGECREAVDFYAKVFDSKPDDLMTCADAPPSPDYIASDEDKDRKYCCKSSGGPVK
ncbi:MAG: hypothetical protein LBS84_11165 [Clostridiales bacterium]|jgi:PhnB protein|nr:hypothetical protein [Clostridiales bacterium]